MDDQQMLQSLVRYFNMKLSEIRDTPQGTRIDNSFIDEEAILSAYKALHKSEMAFKVELSKIGLDSEDESWMGQLIRQFDEEKPTSIPPPIPSKRSSSSSLSRTTTSSTPPPIREEKRALAGLFRTRRDIQGVLEGNNQCMPARILIGVAGVLTLKATSTQGKDEGFESSYYRDILNALGNMDIRETIREDIATIVDDYIARLQRRLQPETVSSIPPPSPLMRAKDAAARVFQSLSVEVKMQILDVSDSVLNEYAASEGLDDGYETDKFKAELTGLVRSFQEQSEQAGIDEKLVSEAVVNYWSALDDKSRYKALKLTAASASAAAASQGLTGPLEISAFVTEITRKSRQLVKIREAAKRVWHEARPKDTATIDDLIDLANSQGFIPVDEAYAFVDIISELKQKEELIEKDAIVENFLTAAYDSPHLQDDDREGLEKAIGFHLKELERAYKEPIHEDKVAALKAAKLNDRQIKAVLENMENLSPTLDLDVDQTDGKSEIAKARLQAMLLWQRELSEEDKGTIARGEMSLQDQRDLAAKYGVLGNDSIYAFIRKLDELSQSVDSTTGKRIKGKSKKKSKVNHDSTVKAREIAEGLWEKATSTEREELAGMSENRLVEMAVMFGIQGSDRQSFAKTINGLSQEQESSQQ